MLPVINMDMIETKAARFKSGRLAEIEEHLLNHNPVVLYFIEKCIQSGNERGQDVDFVRGTMLGLMDLLISQDEVDEMEKESV